MAKRLLIDGHFIGYVPLITAGDIYYDNSTSSLTSINIQDAIDEVVVDLSGKQDAFTAKDGVMLSSGILSNTGVRAVTIDGNYLKVNTNGTANNLTIPYATSAGDGISNITRSGTTFTVTRTNGTTFTFTQKDDNTTYSAGSNITLTGTVFSLTKANVTGALGYTPPTTNTWNANSVNVAGYVSAPTTSNKNKVWKTDGSGNPGWRDDANTTYSGSSTVTLNGTTFSLTKANVTTALGYTPPTTNTTYSAGTGLTLSGTTFSVKPQDTKADALVTYARGYEDTYVSRDGDANVVSTANIGKGYFVQLKVQSDKNLVLYYNGGAIWNTGTSSRRFKHNIESMTEERARKILDVRAVTFDWNDDQIVTTQKEDNAGVIAEEVSQIIPDVVVFENGEEGKIERRVEYERFTPYLIKMCQMQQEQIDEMKAEIEALKDKIN